MSAHLPSKADQWQIYLTNEAGQTVLLNDTDYWQSSLNTQNKHNWS